MIRNSAEGNGVRVRALRTRASVYCCVCGQCEHGLGRLPHALPVRSASPWLNASMIAAKKMTLSSINRHSLGESSVVIVYGAAWNAGNIGDRGITLAVALHVPVSGILSGSCPSCTLRLRSYLFHAAFCSYHMNIASIEQQQFRFRARLHCGPQKILIQYTLLDARGRFTSV